MADFEDILPRYTWCEVKEVSRFRVAIRSGWLAWLGVIAVAVLAFTNEVSFCLAVALACLNFGWRKIKLARWLKKVDPDRRRAKICSRFYLAWGLWKIGVVAFAMFFFLGIAPEMIDSRTDSGGGKTQLPPGCMLAMLMGLTGFLLSAAVAMVTTVSAYRHRIRIWLGPEANWAYEAKEWPPHTVALRPKTSNRTKTIMISALITFMVVVVLMFVIFASQLTLNQDIASMIVFFDLLRVLSDRHANRDPHVV
jgi:nitrate reductase NapE component